MKVKLILILCVMSYNCKSLENKEISKVTNNELEIKIVDKERNIKSIVNRRINRSLTVTDFNKNEFIRLDIKFKNKSKQILTLDIDNPIAKLTNSKESSDKKEHTMAASINFGGVLEDFRAVPFSIVNSEFLTKFELNENDEETRAFYFLIDRKADIETVFFQQLGNVNTEK
ncbi:hypothetical protein [Leptospira bandrabouensis]|uniref:hypothetical protein n=1 Tax=Leptospira bandrabouensis TaxID=2484903 RepID=UPI001EECC228|nr:hypothetical protein [Leptospira bandrabouensis]MCG6154028.1 hypothetical protein [Leptospira bandrabouensis]